MEVYLLFSWIGDAPVAALLYLIASMSAGAACLLLAKAGLRDFLSQLGALRRGAAPDFFLQLGRLWLVGVLLLFPGYLTDIAALLVLLRSLRRRPEEKRRDNIVEARGRLKEGD